MIRVSRKFIESVKLADRPAYRIAQAAGLDSATLSKILHGNGKVWLNDRRVLRVGKLLGLAPEDCFNGSPSIRCDSLLTKSEPEGENDAQPT